MRQLKFKLMFLCVLFSSPVYSDVTGAGDAAILSELVAQTKALLDNVKKVSDALDVQKALENYEELKAIKQLYEEGKALGESINNVEQSIKLAKELERTKYGTNNIVNDIEWLERTAKEAEDLNDISSLSMRVKDLSFMGKANHESKKRLANGTNETDDIKITASNTTILTRLLLKEEEHNLKVEKMNEELLRGFLGSAK